MSPNVKSAPKCTLTTGEGVGVEGRDGSGQLVKTWDTQPIPSH